MSNAPKKIAPRTASAPKTTSESEPKPKKGRPTFDIAGAIGPNGAPCVNDEGQLTAVPSNYVFGNHKRLAKTVFADSTVFQEFRAAEMDAQANRLRERANKMRADAATARQFGDPKKRKIANQLRKAQAALEKFKALAAQEGIPLEALLASAASA